MLELLDCLAASVSDWLSEEDCSALLIADDRQSLANALAASWGGQRFTPYIATFGKYPELIRIAADHLQWDLKVISLPAHESSFDFIRLALQHRCLSRLEFEYGFLLMHLCAGAREKRIVWPLANLGGRVRSTLGRISARYDKTLLMPTMPNKIVTRKQIEAMIAVAAVRPKLQGQEIQCGYTAT